jgi:hypothetical protein
VRKLFPKMRGCPSRPHRRPRAPLVPNHE